MGLLSDIFNDPQKLQRASSFLLGFGQSALQAGQQGQSTLGGLGAGFGGGGGLLSQTMERQRLDEMRQLQQQLAEQAVEQGEQRQEGQRLISQAFDPQTVGVTDPRMRSAARDLTPSEALADPRSRSQIARGLTMAGDPGAALSLGQAAEPNFRNVRDGRDIVTLDLSRPDPTSKFRFAEVSRGPVSGGTNVTINQGVEETAFDKQRGKNLGEQITGLIASGRSAVGKEQSFRQMGDLLTQGVTTGTIQPALTSLRALADDLGVDFDSIVENLGFEIENIGSQQEFQRLARSVVIEGFEKFKGNLNQKEVDIALDAFANLGRTEEANIKAIAAGLAAQRVARERGASAAQVTSEADARALSQQIIEQGVDRFEQLRSQFEAELREQRGMSSGQTIDFNELPE